MHHLFGIRHHGPGSTRSLVKALEALKPDCILVEGPADAEALIANVSMEDLIPPLAMLVYNTKNLDQAAYFPFAVFSPEWQAIKFGLKNDVPVRFMDLPYSVQFALDAAEKEKLQLKIDTPNISEKEKKHRRLLQKDPMAYLAKLAGYNDRERWWEATFESADNPIEIFPAITDLICNIRDMEATIDPRDLLREAFMRKTIRQAEKEGFERIAVVCGAWHTSALFDLKSFKAATDNALLRGIKKVSTKSTWIPWNYERLSSLSGYGAGTLSPAWYHILFEDRDNATAVWMTKAARLLREEDLPTSSAHIIEGVRLARTLATMRNLPLPGIDELKEAAVSVYCDGYEEKMDLIFKKLITGDVIGQVPESIPMVPLQKDLEQWIKSTRLTKYRNSSETLWLKATAKNKQGGIDLRDETDHKKSLLLHRLDLIDIKWGQLKASPPSNTGRFKEYWKLKWQPDFAIKIIEAGMWGNTVYEAAIRKVRSDVKEVQKLSELTELVEQVLKADLIEIVPEVVRELQASTAMTKDVFHLMDALAPLVHALRYGSARKLNTAAIEEVIEQIIPRICVALPTACIGIDDDLSKEVFDKIVNTNRIIHLLENDKFQNDWHKTLQQIASLPKIKGILNGGANRILFDRSIIDLNQTTSQMYYALSRGNDPTEAAHWLQGFLHGSGLLLIHNISLWNILDEWVSSIPIEELQNILPLLRRTFSSFSASEREKMLGLAERILSGVQNEIEGNEQIDQDRAETVMPVLRILFGED